MHVGLPVGVGDCHHCQLVKNEIRTPPNYTLPNTHKLGSFEDMTPVSPQVSKMARKDDGNRDDIPLKGA